MRKPASQAAEPIIEIKKNSSTWEVHWDYQEAPESSVLFKRQEYLGGYIDGSMDMLGILPPTSSAPAASPARLKG